MVIREVCPRCESSKYKKNGHIHNGKQNHHCHDCGRQFVQCFEQYLIAEEKRGLIERLLVERISLRGICRAAGVNLKWLLGFLVQCCEALPNHLHVQPVSCQQNVMIQRLEVGAGKELCKILADHPDLWRSRGKPELFSNGWRYMIKTQLVVAKAVDMFRFVRRQTRDDLRRDNIPGIDQFL
jgi:transposase-like protein